MFEAWRAAKIEGFRFTSYRLVSNVFCFVHFVFPFDTNCWILSSQEETDADTESQSLSLKSRGCACFPLLDDPVGRSGSFRGGEAKRRRGAQNDVDPQTFGSGSTWKPQQNRILLMFKKD